MNRKTYTAEEASAWYEKEVNRQPASGTSDPETPRAGDFPPLPTKSSTPLKMIFDMRPKRQKPGDSDESSLANISAESTIKKKKENGLEDEMIIGRDNSDAVNNSEPSENENEL